MTPSPKRQSYDLQYKQQAVSWLRLCANVTETARRFNVDRRTINRWAACGERIRASNLVVKRTAKKLHPGPALQYPGEDAQLHEWFLQERSAGNAVSNQCLRSRMQVLIRGQPFSASSQWLKGIFFCKLII
jgi:hypothetical protein